VQRFDRARADEEFVFGISTEDGFTVDDFPTLVVITVGRGYLAVGPSELTGGDFEACERH